MDRHGAKKQEGEAIKLPPNGPYGKTVQEHNLNLYTAPECRKFEVRCHADNSGHLEVASDAASVRIGQRVRKNGKEEFWGSLLVECKEHDDGSLTVEVVVFHPDWDEPLRIASIQSNPSDDNAPEPILRCDFEKKHL